MGQIASRSQLRASFLRIALVVVPVVLALGMLSGRLANAGYDNGWFAMLDKPAAMPPGWAFGAAWSVLYVMQGVALAMILHARGNRLRSMAVALFVVQFVLNIAWSPVFFALHEVTLALWLILLIFGAALLTTLLMGRLRPLAAWLMTPYLAWLCFAAALNNDIRRLNPDAERLVASAGASQIAADQE